MKLSALPTVLLTLLCLKSPVVQGAQDCGPEQELCVPVGTLEIRLGIGIGMRSNPLAAGDDIPIVLVPQITYYGERFFFDHLDLGYTLIDRQNLMINTILTPGSDGIFFFKKGWRNTILDGGLVPGGVASPIGADAPSEDGLSPPKDGAEAPAEDGLSPLPPEDNEEPQQPSDQISVEKLHERRLAGMAGVEIISSVGVVDAELQILSDVTGVHHGEELRFTVGTSKSHGRNQFAIAIGMDWKSSSLLNYYYGVAEHEASESALHYTPSSGANPFARVSWSRPINKNWRWLASVQYQQLSKSMRDSPLIESNNVTQVFVGGIYNF